MGSCYRSPDEKWLRSGLEGWQWTTCGIYFIGKRVNFGKQIEVVCEKRDGLDVTPVMLT